MLISGELGADREGLWLIIGNLSYIALQTVPLRFPVVQIWASQPYLTSRDLAHALLIITIRKKRDNNRSEAISAVDLPYQPLTLLNRNSETLFFHNLRDFELYLRSTAREYIDPLRVRH